MKQILTPKLVRKFLILIVLFGGLVLLRNFDATQTKAAVTTCSSQQWHACFVMQRDIDPDTCECSTCMINPNDCSENGGTLDVEVCKCMYGPYPGGECDPSSYQGLCSLGGGHWDGCLCHYY